MFDSFFGVESLTLRFFIAFIVVLGLIGLTAWLVRRFGAERLGGSATRGRQPRLAVIDAAAVDSRRRLVLIRRDNVEHLLLIGGPSDVVVEPNIVRAAPAPREAAPARPSSAVAPADTLPRAVPLGEGTMWPLQPQAEPAVRPQRQQPIVEEPVPWPIEAEQPAPPVQPPQRQSRPVDPLAGLAAELARMPMQPEPVAPAPRAHREPPRMREPVREPAHEPPQELSTEQHLAASDQNLADMAHRLEAALRRPGKTEARSPEPAAKAAPVSEPAPPAVPAEPAPAPRAGKPARAEPKPAAQKSVYDSLEQEMASLLGRPNNKT